MLQSTTLPLSWKNEKVLNWVLRYKYLSHWLVVSIHPSAADSTTRRFQLLLSSLCRIHSTRFCWESSSNFFWMVSVFRWKKSSFLIENSKISLFVLFVKTVFVQVIGEPIDRNASIYLHAFTRTSEFLLSCMAGLFWIFNRANFVVLLNHRNNFYLICTWKLPVSLMCELIVSRLNGVDCVQIEWSWLCPDWMELSLSRAPVEEEKRFSLFFDSEER